MITEITDCRNFYGSVNVKKEEGKYYWCIQDYNGLHWSEIPQYLYDALIKHHNERSEAKKDKSREHSPNSY